jgi:hypothetical protein
MWRELTRRDLSFLGRGFFRPFRAACFWICNPGPLVLSDLGAISIRCGLRQVLGKENQATVSDNPVRCESHV